MTRALTHPASLSHSFAVIAPMRRLRPALFSTFASLMLLLPPSGWSLCIGSNGHFEIEPPARAEQPCCEPRTTDLAPDTCAPEDGSSCRDVALSSGLALRSKSDDLAQLPVLTTPVMSVVFAPLPPSHFADPTAELPARPGGSRIGTIVLRC